MYKQTKTILSLGIAILVVGAAVSVAQQVPPGGDRSGVAASNQPVEASPTDALSVDQGRLADRFERFEQIVLRLAELTATTDPQRAALLRKAIVQSKQQDLRVRFETVVTLLEDEQLALAIESQESIKVELNRLLKLLLTEDRAKKLESEKRRLRRYLKEVNRLIKRERGVKARTEGGDDAKRLAETQSKIAQQAGDLADEMAEDEGEAKGEDNREGSGENTPERKDPSKSEGEGKGKGKGEGEGENGDESEDQQESDEPGQESEPQQSQVPKRIRAAQQRMREARKKLDDAKRKAAIDDQEQALAELEQARAELKEVLRQLREEERERILTMLKTRFRKMLKLQLEVYDGTLSLAKVRAVEREHDEEIEAGRLSRSEALIVREADRAIRLLRDDGTSVAMPEAVEQMREDMQQVTVRLSKVLVNEMTQSIEEDIIAGLEETIAALQKALKDMEEGKSPPGGQQEGSADGDDRQLVDALGELKMIRSLQMRVNRRTERYVKLIDSGQAERSEVLGALGRLSSRQERIQAATLDLFLGKNK